MNIEEITIGKEYYIKLNGSYYTPKCVGKSSGNALFKWRGNFYQYPLGCVICEVHKNLKRWWQFWR